MIYLWLRDAAHPRRVGRFRSHDMSAPHNPSEQELMTAVMGFYGTTMQQVQSFELVLAGFVVAVGLTPPSTPPADPEAFLNEMWKLVHKASAGRMRERLAGKIPEDLVTEIEALVSWRNFFAHRYLRTRLVAATGELSLRASPEDLVELMRLQRAFADGSRRLHEGTAAVLEKAAATGEMASVPPRALYASIEDSLKQMVLAQPPRFESVEATPSGDAD